MPSLVEAMLQKEHERHAGTYQLPPTDLGQKLVEAFFSHINVLMPLLHRPYFERKLAEGNLETSAPFRSLCKCRIERGLIG